MDIEPAGVQAVGSTPFPKGVDIPGQEPKQWGSSRPQRQRKSTHYKYHLVFRSPHSAVPLDGRDLVPVQLSVKSPARRNAVAQLQYTNLEFSVQDVVMMGRPHKRAPDR